MGNDSSKLKGLVKEDLAVEANDFWSLFNAESPTTSNDEGRQYLSIFQGETVVNGQLWVAQGPLERAIKNFMIYRHPYILKYVSTWEQGGQKHLATERVRPLDAVLGSQSDIQVCLGLRTILCSLIFLTEKAMARHLNICTSSIYITENGSWRLAGFECVWKSKDVTKTLLDLANAYRYQPAIDVNEIKGAGHIDYIEQYAFATLCEEILAKCNQTAESTPHVQEFRDYCAIHLKHKNAQMRPKLSAVLLHPYFNHEFVLIHSFLFELPLKSVQEKQDFFTGLIDRLRYFNEEVVGSQLAADLLSRMVLLDPTAQLCVTPYVMKTKTDHSAALFSHATYLRYLMPHIQKMFRLRDAQIRLILLEYFVEFVRLLSKVELQEFVLPHLLAGMNDTNDVLVAKTLRCMADLVPILGAATVIGGQRLRLFSDGRPQAAVPDSTTHWVEPRSITPVMGNNTEYMVSGSPLPDNLDLSGSFNSLPQLDVNEQLEMPPRLSPDGGEDNKSAIISDGLLADNTVELLAESGVETLITAITVVGADVPNMAATSISIVSANGDLGAHGEEEEEEVWSDWETDELQRLNGDSEPESNDLTSDATANTQISLNAFTNQPPPNALQAAQTQKSLPHINDDLSEFDIKVQKIATPTTEQNDEFDFFKDMQPVIETKSNGLTVAQSPTAKPTKQRSADEEVIQIDSSRFAAGDDDTSTDAAVGWGVEDVDTDNWHA